MRLEPLIASLVTLLLAIVPIATAEPSTFPSPITPEIAASPVSLGPAVGGQAMGHAASNGDITLAAWADTRGIGFRLFATRIAADGSILDPLGIDLGDLNPPMDVVWNGTSFVVVASDPKTMNVALVFVSPEGELSGRRDEHVRAVDNLYSGPSGRGASVRMLFATSGNGSFTTTVLDGDGNVVGTSSEPEFQTLSPLVIGADDAGFLMLAAVPESATSPAAETPIVATRFDHSAQVVGTVTTNIPPPLSWGFSSAIASNGNGYLYVRQSTTGTGAQAFALDVKGTFTGYSYTLAPWLTSFFDRAAYRPAVQWSGDFYVVAWATSFTNLAGSVFIATIAPGEATAATTVAREIQGMVNDVSLTPAGPQPLLLSSTQASGADDFDLFVQRVTEGPNASAPKLLATSATGQASTSIATGRSGYAITWTEVSSDRYFRGYVRRFAYGGAPIDSAPILVFEVIQPPVGADALLRVASDGNRFVVLWNDGTRMLLRRMSVDADQWADPAPVDLMKGPQLPYALAVGSNGDGVLAVMTVSCASGQSPCVAAQRISMTGEPVQGGPSIVTSTASAFMPAVASNGSDYLVVWTETELGCAGVCIPNASRIAAARFRSDGTAIDSVPLKIDAGALHNYSNSPSVAWNGSRYVVVWTYSTDGGRGEARGATVASDGTVGGTDASGLGTLLQADAKAASIVAFDGGFALITETSDGVWSGTVFCAACPLEGVAALPRTPLFAADVSRISTDVHFAAWGSSIAMSYSRPEATAGGVARAFTRTFAPIPPRRRVAR